MGNILERLGCKKKQPAVRATPASTATMRSSSETASSVSRADAPASAAVLAPVPPNSARKVVVAMFDFEAFEPDDLAFQKGDQLVVEHLDADGGWLDAQHLRTGQRGFIPFNFVSPADELGSRPWFFANCNRLQSEQMMLPPGVQLGTFMIREATDHNYALSVKAPDTTVRHYKIKRSDADKYGVVHYFINSSRSFSSIDELIEFYQTASNGLCCTLTDVCPRMRLVPAFREMEISRKNIKLLSKLGAGNFGEVWLGKWRSLDVAVKTVKSTNTEDEDFIEEARTMWNLQRNWNHPKLVTLYAICVDGPPWIVSEYMNRGALLDWLRADKGQELKRRHLINFVAQIAEGMAYLEKQQLVHRDLRAANVLGNDKFEVKIADFGLARQNDYDFGSETKFPVRWTAPEAGNYRQFTTKSDVWSFGVLIYEVFTYGFLPYVGMSGAEALSQVTNGHRLSRPECIDQEVYPEKLYYIQLTCWNERPELRPTFESLHDQFMHFDDPDYPSPGA